MPRYHILKIENNKETDLGIVDAKACDSALIKLIGNAKVWLYSRYHSTTKYNRRDNENVFYEVTKLPKQKPIPFLNGFTICFGPLFWID